MMLNTDEKVLKEIGDILKLITDAKEALEACESRMLAEDYNSVLKAIVWAEWKFKIAVRL